MLRPSARMAKAQALAAASMSPPLRSMSGNATRTRVTTVRITRRRCVAVVRRQALPMALPACAFAPADSVIAGLRLADHHAAEEAGGAEDEHDDQDREDDDVGPAGRQQLSAEGLDQADDDAAQHRPGDAADPAEDRRRESAQARGVPDHVAREVVVEAEHQPGGAG